jgi:hypothetical protein
MELLAHECVDVPLRCLDVVEVEVARPKAIEHPDVVARRDQKVHLRCQSGQRVQHSLEQIDEGLIAETERFVDRVDHDEHPLRESA